MTHRVVDFSDGSEMLLIESSEEAVLVVECRHCRRTGRTPGNLL